MGADFVLGRNVGAKETSAITYKRGFLAGRDFGERVLLSALDRIAKDPANAATIAQDAIQAWEAAKLPRKPGEAPWGE